MIRYYSRLSFLLLSLLIISCKERVYDLEQNKIERITYSELPSPVSKFIENNIDSITTANKDIFYSTDPSIEFSYGRGGVADSWIDEVHSNYHHFFVDGIHYRLRGNKGHPFILDDGYLYFCDLNLYKDDYHNRPYFKIRVPKIN